MQQRIENPLSSRILRGEFAEGDTIHFDVDPRRHEFTFDKVRAQADAELAGAGAAG